MSSLRSFVEADPIAGSSERMKAPTDVQRRLAPFAKAGRDVSRLIDDESIQGGMLASGIITAGHLSAALVEYLIPQHGSFYFKTPAATSIAVAGTYYKASGTTEAVHLHSSFEVSGNNRIVYIAPTKLHVIVMCPFSISSASGNQNMALKIAKNGTVLDPSIIKRKTGNAGDVGAGIVMADTEIEQDDYLELYVANLTSATNLTIEAGLFLVFGFPEVE